MLLQLKTSEESVGEFSTNRLARPLLCYRCEVSVRDASARTKRVNYHVDLSNIPVVCVPPSH
jgi:hypothetical protein